MAGTGTDNNALTPTALKSQVESTIKITADTAALDPNKTQGRPHRVLLKNVIEWVETELAAITPPTNPDGVFFTTSPGTPTLGATSITETSSVVEVEGVSKSVASATVSVPLAAAGKKRKDAIAVDFTATPAVYTRVAGQEVNSTSTSPTPVIPTNRLFVRYLDVTDGAVASSETPGYTDAQAIAANAPAIAEKLNIQAGSTTGTALTFLTDRVYGSETTPVTGNITADVTGALLGVTNLIIHNSGTAPTFDSKFYKLNTSKNYTLGVKNYIYCQYLSATRILYTIAQ